MLKRTCSWEVFTYSTYLTGCLLFTDSNSEDGTCTFGGTLSQWHSSMYAAYTEEPRRNWRCRRKPCPCERPRLLLVRLSEGKPRAECDRPLSSPEAWKNLQLFLILKFVLWENKATVLQEEPALPQGKKKVIKEFNLKVSAFINICLFSLFFEKKNALLWYANLQ